jgi:3-deoxy-D-manno-octulosonic-acid transferase
MIIIPRHAERGGEVASILKKLDIKFAQRTASANPANVDCLLADTTGEMLSYMQKADVIIMGKSLAGQNEGHNLIEPALLAKPIITGSVLKNFRFVLDVLKKNNALLTVDSEEQLEEALSRLFSDPELRKNIGENAKAALIGHKGAIERTIKTMEELL